MILQRQPEATRSYAAEQRAEAKAAISTATAVWRTVGQDFTTGFVRAAPDLMAVVNTAQARVTANAIEYVPAVLEATGQSAAIPPRFTFPDDIFVGTAGDGRPTETLLYNAVTNAKQAIAQGASVAVALRRGEEFLSLAIGSLMSDTGRAAEGLATYSRPVTGWVRMLTPPSCGRCVILAGKWFRTNQGFERHPGCDCRHIPVGESMAGDLKTDPQAYLDSLNPAQLRKVLGSKANARAWLDHNADINQLINAYRKGGGIRTAQLYDRRVKYTLEGVSRRGVAYRQMSRVRALSTQGEVRDGGRYRRLVAPRLMPESIFQIATSQSHADRLLRDHGWLGWTR